MKIQFMFFTLLILLLSCGPNSAKKSTKDNLIIGKWSICSTIFFEKNGNTYISEHPNVCPDITFTKNHLGFIKRPDQHKLPFNWEASGNRLVIKHIGSDKDNIVDDGIYKMITTKEKRFHEVILFDTIKNIKYILGN